VYDVLFVQLLFGALQSLEHDFQLEFELDFQLQFELDLQLELELDQPLGLGPALLSGVGQFLLLKHSGVHVVSLLLGFL
jgi:hypothetical protein